MQKKTKKPIIYKKNVEQTTLPNVVNEPYEIYAPASFIKIPATSDFSFKKFLKIAQQVPFTQKEWAIILHLSERTLQRYAKANSSFEGIYVDRILHIEQLINLGLEVFITPDAFYNWLKKDKTVYGKLLNFQSLSNSNGIQETILQLGRILHNVYT